MPAIVDWVARLVDGRIMNRRETQTFAEVPTDHIEMMKIQTSHPGVPNLGVKVIPGSIVRVFTRRSLKINARNGQQLDDGLVPVIEICPDPGKPEIYVRLYLRSDGILLSNEDLNF